MELLPTFLARPQALRADKHHALDTDREGVINELPDLFKRGIGYKLSAWSFFKVEEVLALGDVGGDDLI